MNKKLGYLVIVVFIAVIFISVMLSSSNSNDSIEVNSDYDSAYYIDASDNLFVRVANICDDCCYYVVDMLFGGVEAIFSSLVGN